MTVTGKTATYQIPYFLGTDKPPDMAAVTKAISDRIEALLAKGGDVSIAADGTVTIGAAKVSAAKIQDGSTVTRAKQQGIINAARQQVTGHKNGEVKTVKIEWGEHPFASSNYTVSLALNALSGLTLEGMRYWVDGRAAAYIEVKVRNEGVGEKDYNIHATGISD